MRRFPKNSFEWENSGHEWMFKAIFISLFLFVSCALAEISRPILNPGSIMPMNVFTFLVPAVIFTAYLTIWYVVSKFIEKQIKLRKVIKSI